MGFLQEIHMKRRQKNSIWNEDMVGKDKGKGQKIFVAKIAERKKHI